MCRRLILLVVVAALVGMAGSARGDTLFHWQFEGTPGEHIVSDTDIQGGLVAYKFYDADYDDVNTAYDVNYAEANPWFNDGGTSADFWNNPTGNDPGAGLRVPDPGTNSDLDLSTASACTIEAFVYPYVTDRQSVIVRKYSPGCYYIDTRGSGKFAVRLAGPGGSPDTGDPCGVCNDSSLKMKKNEWQHVALVWDGSGIKFYVDCIQAQELGTEAGPHSPTIPFSGSIGDTVRALGIGCIVRDNLDPPGSSGQFFHGRIDEVRISDAALAPSQFLPNAVSGGASRPSPKNKAENQCPGSVTMSWRAGTYAGSHDVYLGTNWADVNDATTSSYEFKVNQPVDQNSYTPMILELGVSYYWRIDEVNDVCSPYLWKGTVWRYTTNDGTAYDPAPGDERTAVLTDSILSWMPGCTADSHDVYLGTDLDDVNNANTTTADIYRGNFLAAEYDDPCDFDYFKWHYWRVDEVADGTTYKGRLWSFRSISEITDVNFVAWYKLDEPNGIVAADSSGYEHHATVDGPDEGPTWDANDGYEELSGSLVFDDDTDVECPLSVMGKISDGITICLWLKDAYRAGSNNWVFEVPGTEGSFVEAAIVEDDTQEVYWRAGNDSNDVLRWDLEGADASEVEGWHHWAFVKNEKSAEISIYFDGFVVESNSIVDDTLINVRDKQLRFGVGEGHTNDFEGRMDDIQVYDRGLTAKEVAMVYRGGALELAWGSRPGDNAKEVPRDAALKWRPGDYAVSHDVYFGTNWEDVNDADTSSPEFKVNGEPNEYDPPGVLDLDTSYYWRIDEVNDSNVDSPWKGRVWKFTVANYLIREDFESYDFTTNIINNTWLDGVRSLPVPPYFEYKNGATVALGASYTSPPDPVHRGKQSMMFVYDNSGWGGMVECYSEAERIFDSAQNWTEAEVKILTVFFYGDPNNDANSTEQMYVAVNDGSGDKVIEYGYYVDEDMSDIKKDEWQEWNVGLSDFGATLTNIEKMYIGFGDRDNPVEGGFGTVYFDNVRLYLQKCVSSRLKPAMDFDDDCLVGFSDISLMAGDWLRTDVNFFDLGIVPESPVGGLVAWWKLDEGSGSAIADSVGSYNGGLTGAYSWVTGYDGIHKALEFDGGKAVVADDAGLRPTTAVSVSAWVYYSEGQDSSSRVVVKGADNKETYGLEVTDSDNAGFHVRDANNINFGVSSGIWRNEWVHLAGTFDGDSNTVRCYVNGQLVGDDAENEKADFVNKGGSLSQDTNDLAIGNRSDANDRVYEGTVDEVRLYNRALSEAEVAWLASDGAGYVPLRSQFNLYAGYGEQEVVNMRDMAFIADAWLEQKLWPPVP